MSINLEDFLLIACQIMRTFLQSQNDLILVKLDCRLQRECLYLQREC
jgi:hypothetical protein